MEENDIVYKIRVKEKREEKVAQKIIPACVDLEDDLLESTDL